MSWTQQPELGHRIRRWLRCDVARQTQHVANQCLELATTNLHHERYPNHLKLEGLLFDQVAGRQISSTPLLLRHKDCKDLNLENRQAVVTLSLPSRDPL